jgi:hypothetical protein
MTMVVMMMMTILTMRVAPSPHHRPGPVAFGGEPGPEEDFAQGER